MPDDRATKIVALGGSLAPVSRSLTAVRLAASAAEEAGAQVRVFELPALDLPLYAPGRTPSDDARVLAEATYEADGLIWSSPMYHGTISGSFKNALDWLQLLAHHEPPFLSDKVVGLISTAGGVQGLQAVNTMEFVVRALRGFAVPLVIPIAARRAFDQQGDLIDPHVGEQLRGLGREVAELCLRRRPRD